MVYLMTLFLVACVSGGVSIVLLGLSVMRS